jgi:hypothetical protein
MLPVGDVEGPELAVEVAQAAANATTIMSAIGARIGDDFTGSSTPDDGHRGLGAPGESVQAHGRAGPGLLPSGLYRRLR